MPDRRLVIFGAVVSAFVTLRHVTSTADRGDELAPPQTARAQATSPTPSRVAERPRLPMLAAVHAPAPAHDTQLEAIEPETDGLTDDQHWEGVTAELEDRLLAGRGAIHGRVTDRTGAPVLGATVIVTSPALDRPEAAITDEHGYFALRDLPPGSYTPMIYYLDHAMEFLRVEVPAGRAAALFPELAVTVEPDVASDTTSDEDYIQDIPIPGRTFESSLGAAGSEIDEAHIVRVANGHDLTVAARGLVDPSVMARC
jgi:hypothetical protein